MLLSLVFLISSPADGPARDRYPTKQPPSPEMSAEEASARDPWADCSAPVNIERSRLMVCKGEGLWIEDAERFGYWIRLAETSSRTAILGIVPAPDGALLVVGPRDGALIREAARSGYLSKAQVTDRGGLLVELDKGANDGFRPGQTVAITSSSEDTRVIARVVRVNDDSSKVAVGFLEDLPDAATATPVYGEDTTAAILAYPPRFSGVRLATRVGLLITPNASVGAVIRAAGKLHLRGPWALSAEIDPIAFVGEQSDFGFFQQREPGTLLAAVGRLMGAYDRRGFGVGAGFGLSTRNDILDPIPSVGGGIGIEEVTPNLVLRGRFGSEDGLSLIMTGSLMVSDEVRTQDLSISVRLPVGRRASMWARGQAGRSGYQGGDLGLDVIFRGRGGKGTVTAGIFGGFSRVFYDRRCPADGPCSAERPATEAPLLGLSLETRL